MGNHFIVKKIISVVIGLFLSLVALETFLQSTSFIIKEIQSYKTYYYFKNLKDRTSVRIMCIGESTTSSQYPNHLQLLLDNKNQGKFLVIDCGIPGITIETIYENIDNNIKKYDPDIILFMMGINSGFYKPGKEQINYEKLNKTKIKTYKLFLLIKMHISSVLPSFLKSEINQNTVTCAVQKNTKTHNEIYKRTVADEQNILEIISSEKNGNFEKVTKILEQMLQKNPKNGYAYSRLAQMYCNFLPSDVFVNKGYAMAVKGIDYDFIKDKAKLYKLILEYDLNRKKIENLNFYANKIINESLDIFESQDAYFIYGFIKDVISEEQKNKILSTMEKIDSIDKTYGLLAIEKLKQKKYEEANNYFNIAENLRFKFPNKATYDCYKSILRETDKRNIRLICMQYPVRSIEPLKNMLKNEYYYNKITFVSNENIFKQMLKQHHYDDIFLDQFAGDFGHCTDFGNQLIAENVAKTIIEITKK